jgi:hypothetical protein
MGSERKPRLRVMGNEAMAGLAEWQAEEEATPANDQGTMGRPKDCMQTCLYRKVVVPLKLYRR